MITDKFSRIALGSILIGGTTAIPAVAQDTSYTLEEIKVTARKLEEGLQDIPVSVSAFSEAAMEMRSFRTISNIAAFTPNLEINYGRGDAGSSNAAVFIRGVGQNDFMFPTDPGVGIYVDGVYISRSLGGMMELADVERIEVMRGPQGTLYGKNTIGGAINVVTSRPGGENSGKVKVSVGSRNRLDLDAKFNLALSDNAAFKLAGASRNQDGYVTRISDGLDTGDTGVDVLRAALAFDPSDDVKIDFSADYSRIRQNGTPGVLRGTFSAPGGLYDLYNGVGVPYVNFVQGLDPSSTFDNSWVVGGNKQFNRSNGTGPSYDNNDTWGANLTVEWALNDAVSLKSITAYREMEVELAVDMDYSPYPVIHTEQEQEQEQFSQEFQFSGTAADERLTWLAGVYYLREKASDTNQTLLASGIYPSLEALPGAFVPLVPGFPCPVPGGPCAGGAGNPLNAIFDLDVQPDTALTTDNWAGFVHLSYDLTDQFTFNLGGRYSWEEKDYFIDSWFPASGKIATPPTTDQQSWNKFTPKVGVDYRLNEDMLLYASYSQGFKSGGWNPRPLAPGEFKRYGPEDLTTLELGLKSGFWGNRATLNLAAFITDYEDIQLVANSIDPNTGSLLLTVDNAGEVELYGFEAEFVARLSPSFDVNLGVGYLHNEYEELAPNVGYPISNKLPQAPEWTVNAGAQYAFDLGDRGSLVLRGDLAYRSEIFHDPQNTAQITEDGFTLFNARLVYTTADESWEVALFGTNLSDEEYFSSAEFVPAFGFYNGVVGRPSEWGLSVSFNF